MRIHTVLSVLAISLFAGCTHDSKASESNKAAPAAEAVMAKLEKADAADGKTDKIVGKCHCGMEGKKDFAFEYQGYTLYSCNKDCLEAVKKDPAKVITDMKMN